MATLMADHFINVLCIMCIIIVYYTDIHVFFLYLDSDLEEYIFPKLCYYFKYFI